MRHMPSIMMRDYKRSRIARHTGRLRPPTGRLLGSNSRWRAHGIPQNHVKELSNCSITPVSGSWILPCSIGIFPSFAKPCGDGAASRRGWNWAECLSRSCLQSIQWHPWIEPIFRSCNSAGQNFLPIAGYRHINSAETFRAGFCWRVPITNPVTNPSCHCFPLSWQVARCQTNSPPNPGAPCVRSITRRIGITKHDRFSNFSRIDRGYVITHGMYDRAQIVVLFIHRLIKLLFSQKKGK